ncbi:hypothetical protein [Pseudomonas sp. MWU12-2323]|uniref:hypothetical protein n=1 Tax=Pseudomonas sp. MWU12-2323 TaxID=2651296 RepID=UPI00128B59BB|nr:hypothetical protein [Pseudomonas sp. MWU12-2323]MPQ69324.1 hypothetical protein [Pseudomonas sp. MWU12-2323]
MSQSPSVESVMALNGRIFATLSPDEVKVQEFYRVQGRKYDVAVSIISLAEPAELAKASSRADADEIMRRANSTVSVVRSSDFPSTTEEMR